MDNQTLSVKPRNGYGFIYQYTSPSGKIYIGKTKTTLKERAQKNAKGYKGCKAFYNAIEKYGWENFEVEILEEVPLDVLGATEIQYIIDRRASEKEFGYNIVTDDQATVGIFNRIPVYSYDAITGNFIERFESCADAERAMGVYCGSVRRVVNTSNHTCKGRIWKTELFDKVEPMAWQAQCINKKVYVYDAKTGNFIIEYNSVREAARETGYDRKTIQNQLLKGRKTTAKKIAFRSYKVDNLFNESSTTIPLEEQAQASRKRSHIHIVYENIV